MAAASLVARTLYVLASDNKNLSSSALTAINVNVSLVQALMGCLLDCDPGLSCELVKNYISAQAIMLVLSKMNLPPHLILVM